jgi:hypothetical protein
MLCLDCVPKHIGADPTSPHLTVPIEMRGRIHSAGDLDDLMQFKKRSEAILALVVELREKNRVLADTRIDRLKGLNVEIQKIVDDIINRKCTEFRDHSINVDCQLEELEKQFRKLEEGSFADILTRSSQNP